MGQKGFWDWEKRQEKLIEHKEFLVLLEQMIPWEEFRQAIDIIHQKSRKSPSGRKPTDVILMFKMLILQRLYNLSDLELEYQANDRISFMRFLGLGLEDRVPDSSTLWLFREQLIKAKIVNQLFEKFDEVLNKHGYKAKEGQILDASFVPVPKQHNTREENQDIKQGKLPENWKENPQKLSQKDVDARWTKKNGQSYFGYKNHVGIDVKYGFIRRYTVTDASVHDSQELMNLLDSENESDQVWADSAYRSELEEKVLELMGFISQIHERSYRNRPLSEEQKVENRERSRVRAQVEHNFGSWVNEMGGKTIEVIGEMRAAAVIGLRNLAYNMKRFVYWQKQVMV